MPPFAGTPRPLNRLLDALLKVRAFSTLRYREYRLLWGGQVFGTMGTWMDEVTRGWLIYELTDSVVQLGLVRGIQVIPFVLFSPLAGSAADRYSRKTQLVAAQLTAVTAYAAMALLVLSRLVVPWHVYVAAFLLACAQVFQQPARASMISEAVPHEYLTNAIGFNSLIFNVSRGLGPALAGALIVAFGTDGAYVTQALLLLAACLFTFPLKPVAHALPAGGPRESFAKSIVEGWKYSWTNQTVRAALWCVMLASFFIVPFTTLLPVFARDLLQVGAVGQGMLLTAMGTGAFFSAALVANAGHALRRGMMMLVAGVVYGLSVVLFAASPWYALSLAAMALAGLAHVHCNVLVNTVVQTYSAPGLRGRTMSIFGMHQAVITVAAMVLGLLASAAGPRWAVAMMAAAGALSMLVLNFALPKAKDIR
jgi:MFS family permease